MGREVVKCKPMRRENGEGCKLVLGICDKKGSLKEKIMIFKDNYVKKFAYYKYLVDAQVWEGKLSSIGLKLADKLKDVKNIKFIDEELKSFNEELSKIKF